jgi:hypothetical protein
MGAPGANDEARADHLRELVRIQPDADLDNARPDGLNCVRKVHQITIDRGG